MADKKMIVETLFDAVDGQLAKADIERFIEKPKHTHLGDYAFPCFALAKIFRQSPTNIAKEVSEKMVNSIIEKVEAVGGYVNIFLKQSEISKTVLSNIVTFRSAYGQQEQGENQTITIDFSSPNIAKPFSMGHLRSTVIGNALANISEKNGYEVVRINHIGDWGTQFGKLIVAYHLWGKKELIEQSPVRELLKIYVKFHDEAERDDTLNDQARAAFKRLEQGDDEAMRLWHWFREASLKEFEQVYALLGIRFDSYAGEAFYNDKMNRIVDLLAEKELLEESDGAMVVNLENMPPCLIKKTDGTTLYATRDLAAALYRHETYKSEKSFYVVGNEQSLHFKQLFNVLEKIGYEWARELQHIPFGMMLKDGKKMSTRKGKVVLLAEVLDEAIELAEKNIEDKNPKLQHKEEIAKIVGTGAVIFHDLKNHRLNDIDFSLEEMLNFEGETGPYVQYTYARICSLLRKGQYNDQECKFEGLSEEAWPVIITLKEFPEVVTKAFELADPSQIAKHLIELSRAFNKYYAHTRILEEDATMQAKLTLCSSVAIVLKEGLRLLGIQAPEEM
ncbi:arginine--tRNA ligase [Viridibacillus sp. YIM B01967]|uniref:Arginine--tRNA ligase n=1 Tax=Viridibacillus soli TaxID=2798301 RepID=A0ABS1HAI0_9BACL|nr:arginine--tRNA ligase [Viridibacillus soli]MBK3496441.1 arginine--tRNA ligase [Viridibacillus soli]